MSIRESENKYSLMILSIVYKLLLDFIYVRYLSTSYAFYGFYNDFSNVAYVLSWIVFLAIEFPIILLISKSQTRLSYLLLFIYSLIYFVPFTSMLYAGYKLNFILYTILVWCFLVIYIYCLSRAKIIIRLGSLRVGILKRDAYFILIVTTGLILFSVVYLSWKFTGFRLSFDEAQTYVFRAEAFEYQTSAFWGYLYSWSRLIIPLLLCVSIITKKYFLSIGLFVIKMLGFGYDGMRLDLMITIIAIVIPLFFRSNRRPQKLYTIITLGLIGICLLSIVEHEVFHQGEIDRVITFRVLFLPNVIASWFIRFFETHVPDIFRQSFLRYFGISSPYSGKGLDFIISEFISGGDGRANNGLIADCITNFGAIGFAIQPFIVGLWAMVLDKVTRNAHISIIIVLAVYFAYCLTNNFFLIILFTNGGFIVIFYLILLRKFCAYTQPQIPSQ